MVLDFPIEDLSTTNGFDGLAGARTVALNPVIAAERRE